MADAPRIYPKADIKGDLPSNDEPRHDGVDGSSRVGAVDLKSTVDANAAQSIDAEWRKSELKREKSNRYSSNNPHLKEPYTPLEPLVLQSLRRYGDMHPGTVDGEVMMMFVEFANLIIEDLRSHPYWDNPEIDYFTHQSEWRAIPDQIIVSGLLYHYAVQQQSNKIEAYGPMYFKMMNRLLYNRKYGSGKLEMSPYDKGQRPSGSMSYDQRR